MIRLLSWILTPNRADCLSVEGVAREVAVLNKTDWNRVEFKEVEETINETISVKIEVTESMPQNT